MRLATFSDARSTRIGVVRNDHIVDLSEVAPDLPAEMRALLQAGPSALDAARRAAAEREATIPITAIRLEAPVRQPRKFFGLAMNYYLRAPHAGMSQSEFEAIHAQQAAVRAEGRQAWFNKQVTCINEPFGEIELPPDADEVYFEAELAFVIGQTCRNISEQDAPKAIAGFTVCNDVTVGAWCRSAMTLTLGKSFDGFGPTGPWLVTPDEVPDPHQLEIAGYVNGEKQQGGNTRDMIFNCYELVAFASRRCTLEPGDVVTTGMPYLPLLPLKAGDVVRCEIEGIGAFENRVRS
jgi:2-keto-4-pentenoate hydratase/2-oxohepta-3-ene-1,7-dioic acid hydratase in catechol pathway